MGRFVLEIGWDIAFLLIALASFSGRADALALFAVVAIAVDRAIVYVDPAADGPVFARRLAMGFVAGSLLFFVGGCIVWVIQ